ncbi:MAG: cation diffusion facilitator family transporter [Anaerolineales bacterium]
MTFQHRHSHADSSAGRGIQTAFFLNLGFTILEIIVGLWTNSVAILSDSVHDLGDSLSLGLSWWLERYSRRSSDERFSYGYRRFSLLGALVQITILIGGSLLVLSETIPRLLDPEPTNALGMALFALVGIAVNGAAVLRLRQGQTLNEQVVAWHLLEDVLGWVAVFIVGVTLVFFDLPILDPILSVLITGYVLYNVIRNFRSTLSLFLQAVPEDIELEDFESRMRALPKVLSTHHTHVWSLDGEHHVLTSHIVVPDNMNPEEIVQVKCELRELSEGLSLEHTTFEIEFENEDCVMRPTSIASEERQPQ